MKAKASWVIPLVGAVAALVAAGPAVGAGESESALVAGESEPAVGAGESESAVGVGESEPEPEAEKPWPEGLGRPTPFEDPSGVALDLFHRALERAGAGEGRASVAIWGASHTACDHWTSRIRGALQERYGDGGRGFTFAAWPNERAYWQSGAEIAEGTGWTRLRLGRHRSVPDHYGVAGLIFDSEGREASTTVGTGRYGIGAEADRFDVLFQRQPGGGALTVSVDGEAVATVATDGPVGAGVETIAVPAGPHELTLRAAPGAPVRVYGTDIRRGSSGVVVHNLGLAGSRARYHQKWLDPVHGDQLEALALDLVVFAYGGNEGNDFAEPMSRFAGQFERALRRARRHAPTASCLVVGPADKPLREGERWVPRVRTRGIAAAQRRIAHRLGCAYFDTIAFMGGELSMLRWVDEGLARDDYVHFTARGYDRFGDVLLAGLLPH